MRRRRFRLSERAADDLKSDLRAAIFRNYLIYFRATPFHLLIIRILHGRQDISSEDFPESEI